MPIELPCSLPGCDQTVQRFPSQLGHSTKGKTYEAVYCSPAHRQQGTRAAISAAMTGKPRKPYVRKHPPRGDTMVDLVCDYCGSSFKRAISEANRLESGEYKRVFCSPPCRQQGIRKYPKRWICETCGDEYDVGASNFKRSKHHFCSPECYADFPQISIYEPWHPEPTFAAYCAGFVDGEGWIGIKSSEHGKLIVAIGNTHYGVLQHIKNGFSGHANIAPRKSKNPRHKPSHALVFHHNQAWAFLEGILPFLVVKREQAEVGIAFQKLPYPHRTQSEQGLIYFNRIKKLNETGMGNLFMQMNLFV